MNKKYGMALGAIVLMAGLGVWASGQNSSSDLSALAPLAAQAETATAPAADATAPAADAAAPAADAKPVEVKDFSIGAADAKINFIEYASFTCPHCADFHAQVFPKLKADYIDTGKLRFEYREVYFDRFGLWGAMVARCGGEMRYFGITDLLFNTQRDWAATDDPNAVVASLKKIGRTAGMDDATIDVCLKDAATADALVAHFETNFKADGIEGTPSFMINGTKYSNMSYDKLKAVLDAELAK